MNPLRFRLTPLSLVASLMLLGAPATSPAAVSVKCTPLLGDMGIQNSILPLRIVIKTDQNIEGSIAFSQKGAGGLLARYPLHIGPGRYRYEIPVQLSGSNDIYLPNGTLSKAALVVTVNDKNTKGLLYKTSLPLEPVSFGAGPGYYGSQGTRGFLAACVADDSPDIAGLENSWLRGTVTLKPALLPEDLRLYDIFDSIAFFGDSFSKLSPAQRTSLLSWVRGGGRLVIDSSPSTKSFTTDPLLRELGIQLVRPEFFTTNITWESTFRHPETTQWITTNNTFEVSARPIRIHDIAASGDGDSPFAVSPYGFGTVVVSALELSKLGFRQSMKEQNVRDELLSEIILGPTVNVSARDQRNAMYARGHQTWGSALEELSGMKPISGALVFCYLTLFLILVGPVEFFFLKHRGKPAGTWILTPALVILFCLGATSISYITRGSHPYRGGLYVHDYLPEGGGRDSSLECLIPSKTTTIRMTPGEAGLTTIYNTSTEQRNARSDAARNTHEIASQAWTPRYVSTRALHERKGPVLAADFTSTRGQGRANPSGSLRLTEELRETLAVYLLYDNLARKLAKGTDGSWSLLASDAPLNRDELAERIRSKHNGFMQSYQRGRSFMIGVESKFTDLAETLLFPYAELAYGVNFLLPVRLSHPITGNGRAMVLVLSRDGLMPENDLEDIRGNAFHISRQLVDVKDAGL